MRTPIILLIILGFLMVGGWPLSEEEAINQGIIECNQRYNPEIKCVKEK